jgi:hypothetical protein
MNERKIFGSAHTLITSEGRDKKMTPVIRRNCLKSRRYIYKDGWEVAKDIRKTWRNSLTGGEDLSPGETNRIIG